MTSHSVASLSDSDLLAELVRASAAERRSTAELIALLAEVDLRKLYLGCGYSSLFVYCTQALRLSESAAYARITAARASRSFPGLLRRLMDGSVTLTTVSLLAAHLTEDNHEALLNAATNKSRRDVERLVAGLVSQPDVASSLRQLPDKRGSKPESRISPLELLVPSAITPPSDMGIRPDSLALSLATPAGPRSVTAPLGGERYLLRVTLSATAHEKLERARALLRHRIPNGDLAAIVERALTTLVDQLERRKHAATARPSTDKVATALTSRHVPAAVKRAVWSRDHGRCAFVGSDGRCTEVGFLEYHHVVPFGASGATNTENLELRCRAHNAYEATLFEQSYCPHQSTHDAQSAIASAST
jgi:hypothetical protein